MSKLIVPARLVNAAEELKNNYKALFACSDDVKEVMKLAIKQKLLCVYTSSGDKTKPVYVCGSDLSAVYCLSDDTDIIAEPKKLQILQWIKDRYTVCEVKNCVPARLNKETGDYEPVEIEPVEQKTCKWEILSDTKEGVSCRRSCTKSYTARPFMPKYCDDCGKLIEVIGGEK